MAKRYEATGYGKTAAAATEDARYKISQQIQDDSDVNFIVGFAFMFALGFLKLIMALTSAMVVRPLGGFITALLIWGAIEVAPYLLALAGLIWTPSPEMHPLAVAALFLFGLFCLSGLAGAIADKIPAFAAWIASWEYRLISGAGCMAIPLSIILMSLPMLLLATNYIATHQAGEELSQFTLWFLGLAQIASVIRRVADLWGAELTWYGGRRRASSGSGPVHSSRDGSMIGTTSAADEKPRPDGT